jgi:hypothetical protein
MRSLPKDIFTEEEIAELYFYIGSIKDKERFDFEGRTRLDFDDNIPKHILSKIVDIAHKKNPSLEFSSAYMSEYNLKFGQPSLNPHLETTQATYTVDYQLESNLDWRIFIEGIPFQLKDNQAIEINVRHEAHWRPRRKFVDGESLSMIFFHFIDKSTDLPDLPLPEATKSLVQKWDHLYSIWEN